MLGLRELLVYPYEGKYVVIGGNMRLRACIDLGYKEVPCKVLPVETPVAKLREYTIKDNESFGQNDWDILANEWDDGELQDWGMELPTDWGDMLSEESENKELEDIKEDEVPEVDETKEPICKLGDIWQLGNHRLMCGDSTDVNVIDRLMDGVKAKLLLTDPPYGIDVVQNKQVGGDKPFGKGKAGADNIVKANQYAPIIGDDTTDTARANYNVALTCTENQIIFGGNYFTDFLPPSRCWIVWDKQNTGNFADAELAWTSFDKGVRLYHFLWNGLCREGSREVEGKTRVHPTQKPVGMLANILKDFSEENDSILDCFGGSGSTLIACEQLNRKCYMCELGPKYCDVIIERWEKLTGKKAVKL